MTALLSVDHLSKLYRSRTGVFHRVQSEIVAVDGVSFELGEQRTLAVVGESGCGKSTLAKLLLGLVKPSSGTISIEGEDVTAALSDLRNRRRLQLVSQNPWSALNRRKTIRHALLQPLQVHGLGGDSGGRRARVRELIEAVGLSPSYLDRYPSEISGGELQRVTIARALAVEPKILVLDEPTSSLDVSVKAAMIRLLLRLQEERALSYVFITHELDVARHIADDVVVMYLGQSVESGPAEVTLNAPHHPYTQGLLASIPKPDPTLRVGFAAIAGEIPSPYNRPAGCVFHTRCPQVMPRCRSEWPASQVVGPRHQGSCHLLQSVQPPQPIVDPRRDDVAPAGQEHSSQLKRS